MKGELLLLSMVNSLFCVFQMSYAIHVKVPQNGQCNLLWSWLARILLELYEHKLQNEGAGVWTGIPKSEHP